LYFSTGLLKYGKLAAINIFKIASGQGRIMATKHEQAKYTLYPRMTDFLVDEYKLHSDEKGARNMTIKEVLTKTFEAIPEFVNTMDFKIMAEEYLWRREGSHILVPESAATLNTLLKGELSVPTGRFTLPYESFTVAAPKRYAFQGVELPGLLVTLMPYTKALHYVFSPFYDYVNVTRPLGVITEEASENARCLSICYRDIDRAYVRGLIVEDNFTAVLESTSLDEFRELVGMPTDNVVELDDRELSIQWVAFKLVVALAALDQNTEGQFLTPGFKGKTAPQLLNRRPELNPQYSTFSV
jgi:hypothetical protein